MKREKRTKGYYSDVIKDPTERAEYERILSQSNVESLREILEDQRSLLQRIRDSRQLTTEEKKKSMDRIERAIRRTEKDLVRIQKRHSAAKGPSG
jgi:DNA-binding ferritin-like protein